MVQHKPTPEEQLLKLIEGGSGGDASADDAAKGSAKVSAAKTKPKISFGKLPGFLDRVKEFVPRKGTKWDSQAIFNIKTLNKVLLALVIAAAIFLVLDFIFFKPGDSNFLSQVSMTDAVFPVRKEAPQKISHDLSTYQVAAQRRNPFLPPQVATAAGPADSGASPTLAIAGGGGGALADALQGIKLVGISWSENPLAMIEDVSTGRTLFLRKGQEIKGIKVQDISKEKVTVTYQGQEGDLF